ncbi:hypothetical protein, partial [Stutzerimonas nitrititolerans]|uniref:hypothetical protein n=1 Tax=Stutzerimonas nitrititolerans TaxID=2482751 RepID=UPI00289B3013
YAQTTLATPSGQGVVDRYAEFDQLQHLLQSLLVGTGGWFPWVRHGLSGFTRRASVLVDQVTEARVEGGSGPAVAPIDAAIRRVL